MAIGHRGGLLCPAAADDSPETLIGVEPGRNQLYDTILFCIVYVQNASIDNLIVGPTTIYHNVLSSEVMICLLIWLKTEPMRLGLYKIKIRTIHK